jgi:hypothetical protein
MAWPTKVESNERRGGGNIEDKSLIRRKAVLAPNLLAQAQGDFPVSNLPVKASRLRAALDLHRLPPV